MKKAEVWVAAMLLAGARAAGGADPAPGGQDYPFRPVPFTDVRFTSGFWAPRMETNRLRTVRYDFQKCEETGRIDNFAIAGKLKEGPFRGTPFDDSDVVKVVEGASYSLATHPDPELDRYLDDLIAKIAAAQEPDGYLYTARTIDPKGRVDFFGPARWSKLVGSHELYNVGHMYEAAVAHFQATGKRTLLGVAIRNADLICRTFGPHPGQIQEPPGHQEIEIGLAKLYRVTGDRRYLDQARYFLHIRGRPETHALRGPGQQDHQPVVEQTEAVGHAVRATYMYSGMADVAALTGERTYLDAIDRLWDNVVTKKLYLTGGLGARHGGEAYGDAYELPNASAYNETCAAIAGIFWNHRMFLMHGDARYIDVLERTLYNGFLSGVSVTGDEFFYPNPLEADGRAKFNHGSNTRQPWFGCSCCPVNVVRLMASLPGYVYATRGTDVYVNLYAASEATVDLGGRKVKLAQETDYPWDGRIRLAVHPEKSGEFGLRLRVPGWARGAPVPGDLYRHLDASCAPPSVKVNGAAVSPALEKGYLVVSRPWKAGDRVEIEFPMPVRRVIAHEAIEGNRGMAALERGPIVYCVEGADCGGGPVAHLVLPDDAAVRPAPWADFLGRMIVIEIAGRAVRRGDSGEPAAEAQAFTAIPYFAWCHRGPNAMRVWLPRTPDRATPAPRSTLAGAARASASHVHDRDAVAALNDQLEPRNSIDHDIPRHTWWDHRGTVEWVQYDFAAPSRVSAVEVYWFDDTGRGQCRVPQSWRLLRREGGEWKPVEGAGSYGCQADPFNRAAFTPVTTTGLRIEAQLQPDFSGGVLEWKVE